MPRGPRRPRSVSVEAPPALHGISAVSIHRLKDFVLAHLPDDHPLRSVILAERDVLTPPEFLAKMEVWTILLNRRA